MSDKQSKNTNQEGSNLKHDGLFKYVMSSKTAAREFLEYYLPKDFKTKLDLSAIKIEKESYVEENLRRQLSDVVFKVKTKKNESVFVYILIEHSARNDYWLPLRLWQYSLLLCQRHTNNKNKLPLILPIVVYNGRVKCTMKPNFWELFDDPKTAKKLLTGDYLLVNLKAMSDEEIQKKPHLGMIEFFLKHIYDADMIKLWQDFLARFKEGIAIDRKKKYDYIKRLLTYTETKVPETRQQELDQLIIENLEESEEIMRTIAQKYIEQGESRGEARGEARGQAKGELNGIRKTAIRMLKENADIKFVSKVTDLPLNEIKKLKYNR